MPLALGWVHIDQHTLRLQRDSRALTPDSHQPVRVQPASESGKPRERSAADRSRRMFERPGGREFAPALAERGRGQSGSRRTAALSAARMDTGGPRSPDGHGRATQPGWTRTGPATD
jgi:hypothetical protein